MLISLLRREPARWQLRLIVLLNLMFAVFATAVAIGVSRVGSPQKDHPLLSSYLLINAFACFFLTANFAQPWRQGGFVRGLPVPLRTQWFARTVSLTFSGLLPLTLLSAVTELGSAWISREWLALIRRDIGGLAAGWLLIVALLQGLAGGHPASRWATWGRARSFAATFTLIALALAVLVLCLAWDWFPWVAAFSGVVILGGSAVRMPQAVDLVAATARTTTGRVAAVSSGTRPGAVRRCLRHLTMTGSPVGIFWAVLLLNGLLMGLSFDGDGPNPAMGAFQIAIFLPLYTGLTARSVLRMGLCLPLSRRRLFAWTVLPAVVVTALGVTAGWGLVVYLSASRGIRGERVAVAYHSDTPGKWVVEVPARCWRLAWRRPPILQTEAGAVLPRAFPVLAEGWPLVAYHPYDAGTEPSAPLLAAQMSRAVQDVLGISVPRQELERRYLTQRSDSNVYVDTRILIRDYGRIRDQSSRWRVTWTSLALLWFLGLFAAVGPRVAQLSPQAGRPRLGPQRLALALGLVALVLLVALGTIWRKEATSAVVESLIRLIDLCVPAHPLLALLVLGALFAGAFLFHERRFAQMDMPAPLQKVDPFRGNRL